MPITQQELESKLWQAADILRGQIDAADYKNYIFSILFLKRLSDRFEEEAEAAVAQGVPREVALSDPDEHEFFVPEEARWPALTGASMNLGETLNVAGDEIELANMPRLDGVLTSVNWNNEAKLGSPVNREKIIRNLLNHFGDLDLSDGNLARGGGGQCVGGRLRVSDSPVRRRCRQEGGRVFHSSGGCAPDRRVVTASGGDAHLRPDGWLGRYADLHRPVCEGSGRQST